MGGCPSGVPALHIKFSLFLSLTAVKDGRAEIVCSHDMPKVPEFSSLYVIQQSCISVQFF